MAANRPRGPQRRWTNFFKLLDANNNGTIEASDAIAAVEIVRKGKYFTEDQLTQTLTVLRELLGAFINSGDNTNGSVTLEQWLATSQKMVIGKPVSDRPEWWTNGIDKLFTIGDRNNNGTISKEEFIALSTSLVRSVSQEVAQRAYQQLPNPVTREHLQEEVWTWASATVAVSEDASLALLINERAEEKAKEKEISPQSTQIS
eukprot:Phypoly_transcript_19948.p1 GENE.Phypoly_transcript_19948~~Phypoly_transcript_19948.p1  ORF type:complete len:203 (-),score=36.01 Phypoly_transcript_19948:34-642(-)